jgi:hypothetical protein
VGWLLSTDLPPRLARVLYRVAWSGNRVIGRELKREVQWVAETYRDLIQELFSTLDFS